MAFSSLDNVINGNSNDGIKGKNGITRNRDGRIKRHNWTLGIVFMRETFNEGECGGRRKT